MLASSAVRQPPPTACGDITPSSDVPAVARRSGAGAPCVLVVEDDLKLAGVLGRAFARAGITSVHAGSGDAALRIARSTPDLGAAILDVMIPHPDGIEVCHHLRRTRPDLPLIVMSARSGAEQASRARAAGARAFLPKPFSLQQLLAVASELIEVGQTTPPEEP